MEWPTATAASTPAVIEHRRHVRCVVARVIAEVGARAAAVTAEVEPQNTQPRFEQERGDGVPHPTVEGVAVDQQHRRPRALVLVIERHVTIFHFGHEPPSKDDCRPDRGQAAGCLWCSRPGCTRRRDARATKMLRYMSRAAEVPFLTLLDPNPCPPAGGLGPTMSRVAPHGKRDLKDRFIRTRGNGHERGLEIG